MGAQDGSRSEGLELLIKLQVQMRSLHESGQLSDEALESLHASLVQAQHIAHENLLGLSPRPDAILTRVLLMRAYHAGLIDWGVMETFDRGVIRTPAPAPEPIAPTAPPSPPPLPAPPVQAPVPTATVVPTQSAPRDLPAGERTFSPHEHEAITLARFPAFLKAFLAERNIRWGEIIGVIIVIGSAIPLAVMYWESFDKLTKYLLFCAVTLLFLGAGWYSQRAWKLVHASRALIAVFVFLFQLGIMVGVLVDCPVATLWTSSLILLAAAFAAFRLLAGRDALLPFASVGVMVLGQLLVMGTGAAGRWQAMIEFNLVLAAGAALMCFHTLRLARRELDLDTANNFFLTLVFYAYAVSLMILRALVRPLSLQAHPADLALAMVILTWPGLVTLRMLSARPIASHVLSAQYGWAVIRVLVRLLLPAAFVLAYPHPHVFLAVALAGFVTSLTARLWQRSISFSLFTVVYSIAAYSALAQHLARGAGEPVLGWLWHSPPSPWILLPLPLLYLVLAVWLRRSDRRSIIAETVTVLLMTLVFALAMTKSPVPVGVLFTLASAVTAMSFLFRTVPYLYAGLLAFQWSALVTLDRFWESVRLLPDPNVQYFAMLLAGVSIVMGLAGLGVFLVLRSPDHPWRRHLAQALVPAFLLSLAGFFGFQFGMSDAACLATVLSGLMVILLLLTRHPAPWYVLTVLMGLTACSWLEYACLRGLQPATPTDWMRHAYLLAGFALALVAVAVGFRRMFEQWRPGVVRHVAASAAIFVIAAAFLGILTWRLDSWTVFLPVLMIPALLAVSTVLESPLPTFAAGASFLVAVLLASLHYVTDPPHSYLLHASLHQVLAGFILLGVGWWLSRLGERTTMLFGRPLRTMSLAILPIVAILDFHRGQLLYAGIDVYLLAGLMLAEHLAAPEPVWGYLFSAALALASALITYDYFHPRFMPVLLVEAIVVFALCASAWVFARAGTVLRDLRLPVRNSTLVLALLVAVTLTGGYVLALVPGFELADHTLGLYAWLVLTAGLAAFFATGPSLLVFVAGMLTGLLTVWWYGLRLESWPWWRYIGLSSLLYALAWMTIYLLRARLRPVLARILPDVVPLAPVLKRAISSIAVALAFLSAVCSIRDFGLTQASLVLTADGLLLLLLAYSETLVLLLYLGALFVGLGTVSLIDALLPASWPLWLENFLKASALLLEMWACVLASALSERRDGFHLSAAATFRYIAFLFSACAIFFCAWSVPLQGPQTSVWAALAGLLTWAVLALFFLWHASRLRIASLVYLGEAAIAMSLVVIGLYFQTHTHLRFVRDNLPIFVTALALAALAISVLLHRRRLPFYARPAYLTSLVVVFLPMLVVWHYQFHVQVITFLVAGAFLALASRLQRSETLRYVSAAAFNVVVILLLHHAQLNFLRHPQFVCLPIGLTLTIMGHRTARKLHPQVGAFLRTFGLLLVFGGSTADMFIDRTFGWSAVALAAFCVLGILAGMMFRVLNFVYLSVTFLLVDLVTQIIWAGLTNTWVWWVSGIVLGCGLIVLFAVFEKKRDTILKAFGEMQRWR